MRILITATPQEPYWTFVTELARGLERDGVLVVLAVMNGPLTERRRLSLRALSNVEFYESTFMPAVTNGYAHELERAGEWLLRLARDCDVDIVHVSDTVFSTLPWRAPVVTTVLRAAPVTGELRVVDPLPQHTSHALVAPTRRLLDDAQQQHGAVANNFIVPFGRTHATVADPIKEPMIVMLTEGSHDTESTAHAARMAARISWPVFVIGAAPRVAAGISHANTHFLGELCDEDRAAVLTRASVFVQTRAESELGYGVCDAAACRCALVLPDTAELREHWDGAAAFVAPNDDEALRATLIWLIDDAEARHDLGERAQHRSQSFTAERMAAAYLAIYIELALSAAAALNVSPTVR